MKAIVVTDQAAGTAGMELVERPEPQAAINDVVVQVDASGFVHTELGWPSTWADRLGRDRTPSIPGHELAGVVTTLGYGTTGLSVGQRVFGLTGSEFATAPWRSMWPSRRATSAAAGRRRLHGGREPADLGPDGVAGTVRARPPSGGAERPRARRGRRSRVDGDATRTRGRRLRHWHRTRCRPSEGARLRRERVRRPRQRRPGRRRRSRSGVRCHRRRHREAVRRPIRAGGTRYPSSGRPRRGPPTAWRSTSLSSPIVPNWVRSSSV